VRFSATVEPLPDQLCRDGEDPVAVGQVVQQASRRDAGLRRDRPQADRTDAAAVDQPHHRAADVVGAFALREVDGHAPRTPGPRILVK